MKSLFEPVQLGKLHLPNRIVMAPLTRNRAPDAIPTPLMAEYYAQRASAGLIISEATAITHQGQGYADVPGLYSTEQLDAWKRVTQAVHGKGGRIWCQLWHVGRVSLECRNDILAVHTDHDHRSQTRDVCRHERTEIDTLEQSSDDPDDRTERCQ